MNEEAIQDSYNIFVSQGYTKSIDEYKKLKPADIQAVAAKYLKKSQWQLLQLQLY